MLTWVVFFVCVLGARRTEVAEVTAEGESGSWTEATQWRETETRGAPKKARTSGDWEEASYGQDCCSQENNCGGKGSERLDRGGDAFFFLNYSCDALSPVWWLVIVNN